MEWVKDPAYPNDYKDELPQYMAAHYRAAAFCLQKKKGTNATINAVEVSAFYGMIATFENVQDVCIQLSHNRCL